MDALEKAWKQLRKRYSKLVDKLEKHATPCRRKLLLRLEKKLSHVRSELKKAHPKKYPHYGDYNATPNYRKLSPYGDNGYLLCRNCCGLFYADGAKDIESYLSCSMHRGQKAFRFTRAIPVHLVSDQILKGMV